MKKVTRGISRTVQWVIAIFLGLATVGAFMENFGSGICCLISTLLVCPKTRDIMGKWLVGKNSIPLKRWLFKKDKAELNGAIVGILAFIFLCAGTGAVPETASSDASQTIETTAESNLNEALEGIGTVEGAQASEALASIDFVVETQADEVLDNTETVISTANEDISSEHNESTMVPSEVSVDSSETVENKDAGSDETKESPIAATETFSAESSGIEQDETAYSDIEVHFIDVGQGDATLIKADSHYMLIDAGDNSKGTAVQLYLKKQSVEKLDYLILTHADADHIGGADVIISKFDVDTIFIGGSEGDNSAYEEVMDAIEYKRYKYSTPEVGAEYQLGNAIFTIVAPNASYDNNSSIGLMLKNGDNTFLFTGDCEAEAEADILSNGLNIDVDVYKVGHHGSRTSSGKAFLDAMTPTYAVISCAEGNSYGHPHAEPLNNLRVAEVKVFRTDEQGSIIAYSDGNTITWNCAPSESWKAGESTQRSTTTEGGLPSGNSSPNGNSASSSSVGSNSEKETVPTENSSVAVESTPSIDTDTATGRYAVNAKNGKIHIVGDCPATGAGKNAMSQPVYFGTYEDAEAYSMQIAPSQDKRKCGNCW